MSFQLIDTFSYAPQLAVIKPGDRRHFSKSTSLTLHLEDANRHRYTHTHTNTHTHTLTPLLKDEKKRMWGAALRRGRPAITNTQA